MQVCKDKRILYIFPNMSSYFLKIGGIFLLNIFI